MKVEFNALNKARKQILTLCNPNGEELDFLGIAKDIEYSKRYNETSSLSFTIPKYKDDDLVEYYDRLVTNRVVKLEHEGAYLINKVNREFNEDGSEYKSIQCVGLEYEFADKTVGELKGTYCLYDGTGASKDKELMNFLLTHYLPTWKIKEVDSDLWNVYRTFDLKDKNVFNLLMGEVAKSFDCVFLFDTFDKSIEIVKTKNIHKPTDIYISAQNLMRTLNIEEDSDSLVTALAVFGGGDLTIRNVNPLGGMLYNFNYFVDNDFLSTGLAEAVRVWEEKCEISGVQFTALLNQIKEKDKELLVLQTDKTILEAQKKALEQHHAIAIAGGDNTACAKYKTEIANKETEIKAKQGQIDTKSQEIVDTQAEIDALVDHLSMDNTDNFTAEQRLELNPYIKQGSVTNGDFIITDEMTLEDITEVGQELMEWGEEQLEKCSKPIWNFEVDMLSFTSLIEYKDFTSQLDMGSEVVIEIDRTKDLYAYTMLVGYNFDVDRNVTTLSFSNQLNYKSKSLTFEELFESSATVSKDYAFDTTNRNESEKTTSKMDEYIENGFIDITKDVLSTTNQEFEIGDNGIRGREWIPETQSYSGEEIRITKNVLAFSDNNFATTKTAIGKVLMPDGTHAYGVIAENLVGKQILGKTLLLETENKSLVWDGESLTIKNANIIMGDDRFLEDTLLDIEGIANTANSTANTANNTANSASGKVNGVVNSQGNLIADKLYGTISAGKTNIVLGSGSKYMRLNENGILITKDGGKTYGTAIGVDGIIADMIKAGGTISGCNAEFGQVKYGNRGSGVYIGANGTFTTYADGNAVWDIFSNPLYSTLSVSGVKKTNGDPYTAFSITSMYEDEGCTMSFATSDPSVDIDWNFSNYGGLIKFYSAKHFEIEADWVDINSTTSPMRVIGGLTVSGSKNAIVPTQHYGARLLYCEEGDKSYFTTKGIVETVNCEQTISLDPIFTETIELNSNYPYIIQLTSYSDARVWIEQVNDYDFVVKSDKETKFTYELSALRITFGDVYLEEHEMSNKNKKDIQKAGIDRMNNNYKEKE